MYQKHDFIFTHPDLENLDGFSFIIEDIKTTKHSIFFYCFYNPVSNIGVSVSGISLNWKERLFSVMSIRPREPSRQAAIGAVPLAAGVKSGELILAMAVLAIVITAPLGAAGIKLAGTRWLNVDKMQ